jgi:hypothetical protein
MPSFILGEVSIFSRIMIDGNLMLAALNPDFGQNSA